jgi:hypothetical protein
MLEHRRAVDFETLTELGIRVGDQLFQIRLALE